MVTYMQNDSSPTSINDDSVLFQTYPTDCGHLIGEMTLNAPKSLNALSVDMCERLASQLAQWQQNEKVVAVLLRGSGDKAFCAGGDIRKLYDSMVDHPPSPNPYATEFFSTEYDLYRQMHFYTKPLILWGNGIVMGGGMGLMAGCSHRIVTETTKFAMPEITIGLFPDATGSWFLQRMPAKSGLFLGLTGAMCNASDAMLVNLAEYAIPSESYEQMVKALTSTSWHSDSVKPDTAHIITSRCLATLSSSTKVDLKPSKLAQYWQPIHKLMTTGGLKDIDTVLQDDSKLHQLDSDFAEDKWTQRAVATYRHGCPVSAVLTHALYERVSNLSLEQVLYLETNVAVHCANNPDFQEGVRALLIDKDRNPSWSRTLDECLTAEGQQYIANHFSNPYPEAAHPFTSWLSADAFGNKVVR